MPDMAIGVLCLICSLVLIQSGMHIGVAMMLLSFLGVWAIKSFAVAGKLLAGSVTTSIASDDFGVIPLFVIMGLFVSVTGMGRDTFDIAAQLIDSDAVLARANAQVDQAERALAEARRVTLQPREGLRISSPRLSRQDEERIEYCKRGVKIARQQLMEILRERQRG